MIEVLIALQAIQVAILWLHDWVPLGRLNDVAAVRRQDGVARLIRVTLIQSVPFTIGLAASVVYLATRHPAWVWTWLWVSYALLFAGELRAWWWPYLIRAEPERAARYRRLFGATAAFLPERNGISPNILHTVLHAATAATLVLLVMHSLR
jgi:hypothetical protein